VVKAFSKYLILVVILGLSSLFGCSKDVGTPETLSADAKWCANHLPGQRLSYAEFDAQRDAIEPNWKYSQSGYEAYLNVVDREAIGVLYRIFSEFKTSDSHVWYGSFNAIDGKFSANDRGEGFRVVGKRTFTDASGKRYLALVIAFWTYRNGKLQLKGGPDSMRVRMQIAPDSATDTKGRFAGISYQIDTDENGKVKAITPTIAYDDKGSQKSGVSSAPAPSSGHDRCFYCHTDTSQRSHHGFSGTITGTKDVWTVDLRDNVVDETKVTPETMDSIKKFVETMSKPAPEVIESFKKPKETFMPEGLLSVLAERCDAIGKTDKK